MSDVLLRTIAKNRREEFRIAVRTFKGHRRVDLRVYAHNGVDVVATAKGVAIRPDLLGGIIEALLAAQAIAEAEGPVPRSTAEAVR